jgi:DNA-binding NarL/FixJ family response regulator
VHRILIVDDHVAIREGLAQMLSAEFPGSVYGSAANAQEALTQISSAAWDIVILDLNLPGRGGLKLIRDLKDTSPSTGVLVYTVHPDDQFGVRALRAGADGYLTKDQPAGELIQAIRKIRQGRRHINPELAESLANYVTGAAPAKLHDLLSDREMQILRLLASGHTPTEIAGSLNLSIKTMSTYRSRILEKLNLRSSADIIRYAIMNELVD